jgi:hypothetical protein
MTNEKATLEIFRKKLGFMLPVCVFVHGEFQKSVGFVSRIRVFLDGENSYGSRSTPNARPVRCFGVDHGKQNDKIV